LSWPKIKLGDCCEIVSGATPKTGNSDYWGGDIPWVSPKSLSKLESKYLDEPTEYITQAGFESCSTRMLPAMSLLLSCRAPVGLTAINREPICTNQGFKSLIPNPEIVDVNYLFHVMRKMRPMLEAQGRGATFTEVSKAIVARFEIPLPPLDEQRRIALILDKADEIYASVSSSIEMKSAVIRSIFLDMFGDMLTNSMVWPTSPLGEICDTQLGKAISKEAKLCLSPSKYLRNANVQWREIHFSDLKEMDFKENEKSKLRILDGDILATEGGDVGRCAIWNYGQQEIFFQNSLHRIRVDDTLLTPEYLVEYFAIMSERGGLIRETTQVTIAHLTGTKLRKLIVPLPPLEIQKRFSRILERINSFHTSAKQRTNEITLSLQQEMFA